MPSFPSLGSRNKLKLSKEEISEQTSLTEQSSEAGEKHTNGTNGIKPGDDSAYGSVVSTPLNDTTPNKQKEAPRLQRTPSSFWEDAKTMKEGSVPQSIVVATVVGIICGVAANYYYKVLEWFLEFLWHTLPQKYVIGIWPEWSYPLWIPLIGLIMAIGVGASVKYVGEPGDLAYTIKAVHEKAYLSMDHCMPMVLASQFSILGGGSLGPEAPLVAICACLGGWVSRTIFKQTKRNVIRKHTLMGMAGALAAFFGSPLGGSLFALEVNSRFGVEYFEHVVESIFCGEVTLAVFRFCAGLPIGPIWTMTTTPVGPTNSVYVLIGVLLGLLGAGIAALFANFHWKVMGMFEKLNLLNDENAIWRGLLGASAILSIGMFIPQTLFWGENEFQQISTLGAAEDLPHVWPTSGFLGYEMDSALKSFLVGFFKMIAISFTVSGGYRGGFIFPFFASGAAFGRTLTFFFPSLPAPYACLCIAAGINVAITRTALATSIILTFLSGQQNCMSAVLASALTSLFVTSYMVSTPLFFVICF